MDLIADAATVVLALTGLIALPFAAGQLSAGKRAHLLDVYKQTFEMLDRPEIRTARRYVYHELKPDTHKREFWLGEGAEAKHLKPEHKEHREMVELIARSFDQLGLLIREGRVPVNILARFYASPALRCWCKLTPYIEACRSKRNQPGHLWEWENLVFKIIGPGLDADNGVWKGVSSHDGLKTVMHEARLAHDQMLRDVEYSPRTTLWELGRWYAFWTW